jgi:hypothetical protein
MAVIIKYMKTILTPMLWRRGETSTTGLNRLFERDPYQTRAWPPPWGKIPPTTGMARHPDGYRRKGLGMQMFSGHLTCDLMTLCPATRDQELE